VGTTSILREARRLISDLCNDTKKNCEDKLIVAKIAWVMRRPMEWIRHNVSVCGCNGICAERGQCRGLALSPIQ